MGSNLAIGEDLFFGADGTGADVDPIGTDPSGTDPTGATGSEVSPILVAGALVGLGNVGAPISGSVGAVSGWLAAGNVGALLGGGSVGAGNPDASFMSGHRPER